MERDGSADLLVKSLESSRARLTRMPPRECATQIMALSSFSSLMRSVLSAVRSVCACWCIMSELADLSLPKV